MAKKIKKEIRAAGANISNKEMKAIVKAAGGNVQKAVNRIASVQQSQKAADKPVTSVASGAANMLIKQGGDFGTSKLGQTLQGMVAQPATSGTMIKGQQVGATPAQAGSLVPGGMVIRPGGTLAVKKPEAPKVTPQVIPDNTTTTGGGSTGDPDIVRNPNQELLDRIAGLEGILAGQTTTFQDTFNTQQQYYDQQMADLGNMFNMQIAQQQDAYNQQVQQAALLAQQEQEAARAFMINQGRSVMPANLQIGANYGTPQLAGTQGFKSPSRSTTTMTPSQVATAFTTPTLAAATQPTQTPVLNV